MNGLPEFVGERGLSGLVGLTVGVVSGERFAPRIPAHDDGAVMNGAPGTRRAAFGPKNSIDFGR